MTKSHGHTKDGKLSPTYTTWWNMLKRCDPNTRILKNHKYYVDKGITVCPQWHKFEGFLADMGEKPDTGFTIDRIDAAKNYEPGNCKWVTQHEQRLNNSLRQFCKRGHPLTKDNIVGSRNRCRICKNAYQQFRAAELRSLVDAAG